MWSKLRSPNNVNNEDKEIFATEPTIDYCCWQQAFDWLDSDVTIQTVDKDFLVWRQDNAELSLQEARAADAWYRDGCLPPVTNYDATIWRRWRAMMKVYTFLEKLSNDMYVCSCSLFSKFYKCHHSIGMAYQKAMIDCPSEIRLKYDSPEVHRVAVWRDGEPRFCSLCRKVGPNKGRGS